MNIQLIKSFQFIINLIISLIIDISDLCEIFNIDYKIDQQISLKYKKCHLSHLMHSIQRHILW